MNSADIDAIVARLHELEEENSMLKLLLSKHGISYEGKKQKPIPVISKSENIIPAMQRLSLQEKVKLFRTLFKGREDVFAKRWYSDVSKKSGYQPVCEREWNNEFCDKRKYKCTECPNRLFALLTDEYIYNHLAGKDNFGRDVVGVYPIMSDNTCNFLCTDFDDKSCEHGFQNDVLAFVCVCHEWEIPCYIERSRSGNGAHVWIFFETPITATKARKLGKTILSEAMNKDARLSFNSYDRFFPNQDTLPEGGMGNLMALPLQGKARRDGNSVFVDEEFQPYTDQWDFLIKVQKIDETRITDIILKHNSSIGELTKSSESKPWETPKPTTIEKTDFPSSITIIRANMLYIPLVGLSAKAINHFKRIAAFYNPEFYAKQGMRLSTYDIPRIISCSEMIDDYLAIPRGCENDVIDVLKHYNIEYVIEDKTNQGRQIDVAFKGTLRKEQQMAMSCMLPHNIGTLSATTAFGKTVFAIAMIADRKVNTLILVHRKSLLDQWKKHLEDFLEINEIVINDKKKRKSKKQQSSIGTLYSGRNSIYGIIDIALIQSCFDGNEVSPFVENYGMVIIDECHHVSSVSFEQVLRKVKAKYVYGLTATPIRKDGHQPIIFMQCGKIRFTADAQSQMNNQSFSRILIPRFTTFRNISSDDKTYTQIVETISKDEVRNSLIIDDVHKTIIEGRTPIVLTSLTSHVRVLADLLLPYANNVITLVGADSTKEKRCAMERLQNISATESLVIVATGKYIGEGFDYPRLDTLFLVLPISWKGNIAQYAGRLHRDCKGKSEARIYDYVDVRVPLCDSMYRKRLKGYASVGYGTMSTSNMTETTKQELIFDGNTYKATFQQDLIGTKQSLVISCLRIKYKYLSHLISQLRDLLHNGIEIAIHIKERGYNEKDLSNAGIDIIHREGLSIQCVIIDKSIIWYGNVNFFGYNNEDNNVMRICDASIASELLNVIYEDNPLNLAL